MKKSIALASLLLLGGCDFDSRATIVIETPCDTFVSSAPPERTPAIRQTIDGQMLLEISFTPAEHPEAARIAAAVKRRPTVLRVAKTGRIFEAVRGVPGGILVRVHSVAEAEALLQELCFEKGDFVISSKEAIQAAETTRGK
jgi:hypothetical protein